MNPRHQQLDDLLRRIREWVQDLVYGQPEPVPVPVPVRVPVRR